MITIPSVRTIRKKKANHSVRSFYDKITHKPVFPHKINQNNYHIRYCTFSSPQKKKYIHSFQPTII